jgi:hypothetical protein
MHIFLMNVFHIQVCKTSLQIYSHRFSMCFFLTVPLALLRYTILRCKEMQHECIEPLYYMSVMQVKLRPPAVSRQASYLATSFLH